MTSNLRRKVFTYSMVALMTLLTSTLVAQTIDVKGIITTESGAALAGATVIDKSTQNGVVTNAEGAFSIKAQTGAQLEVNFIGYVSQTFAASLKSVKIALKEDMATMDDVVVIGYGAVKKSDLTGSVSTVKMNDITTISANSVEKMLQGRSAGLQIINSDQGPGSGATVRIRGGSSLKASSTPLIVVDGFPLGEAGNLSQINPSDIASIEILKDASSSAIYGSRGANGVILITTNRAKAGQTIVSVKHKTTISQFSTSLAQWSDPALMAQINNEGRINSGLSPNFTGQYISGVYYPSISEIQTGAWPHFTDWSKIAFRDTPVTNNTSISVSNANDKTSFLLSGNFYDQQGIYIKDDYMKGNINLNVSHKFGKIFSLTSSNNISKNQRDNNGGLAYWRSPLLPVYNEDGTYYRNGELDFDHPLATTEGRSNVTKGIDFITSWLASLQITKDLNLKSQLNYKYGTSITDKYDSKKYTANGYNNNGAAYLNNWNGQNIVSETYLTYDKMFSEKHKLNVMAGYFYEGYIARESALQSYDFVNEALGNENMNAGTPSKQNHTNGLTETKLASYMGRVNYTYDDRFLFTATFRADGSSKFGDNNKWAYFPSAAASWKMHNEDFIKNLNTFDELKIRASYGISGNQGISPYQTLSIYGLEKYYVNGAWTTAIGPGYVVGHSADYRNALWGGIPNRDLKWETTKQWNIGADMGFFNNRLRVTFDYYTKLTSDLLRERILPLSSGYNKMMVNDGEIRNRGFEITIDGNIVQTKDFSLSGTLIFSRNRNKVVSLGNAVTSGLSQDYMTGMYYEYFGDMVNPFRETSSNILAIGQPINVFYGYRVNGILQSNAEGLAAGLTGKEAQSGEYKYMDLSENGIFDTNDRTIIGDPNPDFTASLNLSAQYKNFDLSVFLNAVYGNDVLYGGMYNQSNFAPLRWTVDNPSNEYPRYRDDRLYYTSDWFIKDGSFLRIQNVSLGYTFRPNLKWMSDIRVYVNVDNLYTFTKFPGYDPEVGLDGRYNGGYPRFRNWTFGIDLTF